MTVDDVLFVDDATGVAFLIERCVCIAGCDAESEACCDVILTTTDTISSYMRPQLEAFTYDTIDMACPITAC